MPTDDLERLDADDLGQYVPAVYARTVDEADQYAELLHDHNIPSVVDEDYESQEPAANPAPTGRIPVLVPESLVDDARGIITEFDEMAPYVDEDDQPAGQGFDDDEDEYSTLGVTTGEVLLAEEEEEDEEQQEDRPVAEVEVLDDEDDLR